MIDGSDEMDRRIAGIIADLKAAGMPAAAQRLAEVQSAVYTTGSEWRGEIARAALSIRRLPECPRELKSRLRPLLAPGFAERVVHRQLWQGIRVAVILTMLGGAVVAIATSQTLERHALLWTAGAVVLIALLWISTRHASVCPGCATRIRHLSPGWCPYCGTDLHSGITGPRISVVPETASKLLTCPSCGHPPGGLTRYGRRLPSEGHFCTACGERLPDN